MNSNNFPNCPVCRDPLEKKRITVIKAGDNAAYIIEADKQFQQVFNFPQADDQLVSLQEIIYSATVPSGNIPEENLQAVLESLGSTDEHITDEDLIQLLRP